MNKSNIVCIILCVILLLSNISTFIYFSMDGSSSTSSVVESTISDISSEETKEESSLYEEESSIDEEVSEENEEPELEPASSFYELLTEGDLVLFTKELEYCEAQSDTALEAYNNLIALGYSPEDEMLICLEQDAVTFLEYANHYTKIIQDQYAVRYPSSALEEYPAATYIWGYMKDQGWSDYVCAGIMGNIMQETGGRTLDIDYMHSNKYYGMCCWRKDYHPEVVGLDLEGQCAYLVKTTISCFNDCGYLYEEGYDFEKFLAAESIKEAAAAFMIVYERPGHTDPTKRTENGEKAYKYFVG